MHKTIFLLALTLTALACGPSKKAAVKSGKEATYGHLFYNGYHPLLNESTFQLDSVSADKNFGYTIENPVMVGGNVQGGAFNERRFLNALLGPKGETVSYTRQGSCCGFSSPNGLMGGGLLDRYEVKIEGDAQSYIIYINMYDKGILRAPNGFTFKK